MNRKCDYSKFDLHDLHDAVIVACGHVLCKKHVAWYISCTFCPNHHGICSPLPRFAAMHTMTLNDIVTAIKNDKMEISKILKCPQLVLGNLLDDNVFELDIAREEEILAIETCPDYNVFYDSKSEQEQIKTIQAKSLAKIDVQKQRFAKLIVAAKNSQFDGKIMAQIDTMENNLDTLIFASSILVRMKARLMRYPFKLNDKVVCCVGAKEWYSGQIATFGTQTGTRQHDFYPTCFKKGHVGTVIKIVGEGIAIKFDSMDECFVYDSCCVMLV